mgnify:CR=1 FL=1
MMNLKTGHRKKYFMLVSIIITLAVFLVACGGKSSPVDVESGQETTIEEDKAEAEPEECDPVVLNYWDEFGGPADAAVWDPIFEEFNATHECIQVEVRHIADDNFFTAIRTGVTSANPPDVFMHESGLMLKELVEAGAVMDITDWWEENEDRWQPGTNEGNIIDGVVYAVPFESFLRDIIAWNEDILEEYNIEPPQTFDDLLEACDVLSEAGEIPLAIGNQRGWPGGHIWQTMALRIAGAEKQNKLINREGVHWTDPDFILASERYLELKQRNCLSPGFASDDFGTGEAIFLGGNAAFYHPLTLTMPTWPEDLNYDWGRWPMMPDDQQPYADKWDLFLVNIYGFSISSKTEHPDEALVLFEYLVSPEVQKKFVNNERITPMVGILEEDKISNDLARWQEIIEQGTGTIGFVVLEIPAEVSRQIFDVGASAVWTEQMTPREWMEAMEIGHAELTNTEPVLNP